MKPLEVKGYVIYDENEQTFCNGGMSGKFSKTPKIYKNIGHIKNHLNQHISTVYDGYKNPTRSIILSVSKCYKNRTCNVYDITTNKIVFSVSDFFKQKLTELRDKQITIYRYAPENITINY